jgi:hypothetical protein
MANGTPSTSISLGAELLEQMGDLKGAAKELSAEAKNAKKDVSDAQKEFKELEKQQKKNEREAAKIRSGMDKMTGKEKADAERQIAELMDSSKVDSALSKVLDKKSRVDAKLQRSQVLKDKAKDKAEHKRNMQRVAGGIDRGISAKLFRAEDQLQGIAKQLLRDDRGSISQFLGKGAGRVAGLAGQAGEGLTSVLGGLGPAAGIAGAAYAGFKIGDYIADIQRKQREREKRIGISRGVQADVTRNILMDMTGNTTSRAFASSFAEDVATRQSRARADVEARSVLGGFDTGMISTAIFGGASQREFDVAKRSEELQKDKNAFRVGVSKFGESFMKNISAEVLKDSAAAETAWRTYLEEHAYLQGVAGFSETLAGKEEFKQEWASKIQASTIAGEEGKRATLRKKANEDPAQVAERHVRATQSQGLERQRQRREMQTASF